MGVFFIICCIIKEPRFFFKGKDMPKTTVVRGNILEATVLQAPLPSTTIAGTSAEVIVSVPGVFATDVIFATFDGSLVTGISIGNAYTNTADQVRVRLINSTGSSATQTAGTLHILVMSCEDLPLPTSTI
jgi:hypothetical protein